MEQVQIIGKYNSIENAVFFENGRTHYFKGLMLTQVSPEEKHHQLQKWAQFKGLVKNNEEIYVPGFTRNNEEEN